jgi:hypothetical protein
MLELQNRFCLCAISWRRMHQLQCPFVTYFEYLSSPLGEQSKTSSWNRHLRLVPLRRHRCRGRRSCKSARCWQCRQQVHHERTGGCSSGGGSGSSCHNVDRLQAATTRPHAPVQESAATIDALCKCIELEFWTVEQPTHLLCIHARQS